MKPALNRCGWLPLGLFWSFGGGGALADWPAFEREIREDVIPLDGKNPAVELVRQDMPTALHPALADGPGNPRVAATPDKGYVLAGDLFGTGGFFALYEPKITGETGAPTLALAELQGARWQLRGLWTTPVSWKSPDQRWEASAPHPRPKDAPSTPFVLEDVTGDGTPEVIVAGELMKYRQVSYLLRFDARSHGLEMLAHSMAKPVRAGNYVRLYEASPNKAIWRKWRFMELAEGKLREHAVWHIATPQDGQEPFIQADIRKSDGEVVIYRMVKTGDGQHEIMRNDEAFAKVTIQWKSGNPATAELSESAWFFRKLTGLRLEDYPETGSYSIFPNGKQENHTDAPPERLEEHAIVGVTGTGQAMKLLSRSE